MQSPAAMFIESAADSFSKDGSVDGIPYPAMPIGVRESELKELASFGDMRAQKLSLWDEDSNAEVFATGLSADFRIGYLLGLQVARMVLAGSVALALAKVKPEDVL
jgi:hypothetical protein